MKYIGIDYGEKRVGIANSDVEGKIAFPHVVLENNENLISIIATLAGELGAQAIVIGESKDYKGEENKINKRIIQFKQELMKVVSIPLFLEPEFMSSMQVEKNFGTTAMLDASAAAIILQTYLDKEKVREEKKAREAKAAEEVKGPAKISYDDFKRVEMTVGKILSAEPIEGSDKLLKLSVDFAEGTPRQIVSGISKYFSDPKTLIGKHVAFVTNLAPRPLMGLESNGMILAAKSGETLALAEFPDSIAIGTILG